MRKNIQTRLLTLLACLLCSMALQAENEDELLQLESDMLEYFSKQETDTFFKVTTRLKEASRDAGKERMFYDAWGNEAVYEATVQNYPEALRITDDIMNYARENGSIYGEYVALHSKAMTLLQKQSYDEAEQAFLKAVEFRHHHFPDESAGEDLQELMKIANHRKDGPAGVGYARQILAEPNVAPIHKGRALYRLSQMAFNKNDSVEFNRIYREMMELKKTDGIGTLKPVVEVNYCIMNGMYDEALRLADELEPEARAERKAVIYHRMGNDGEAFKYMQQYKKISDSIVLVSHGNVVASCYVQMNNERLQLEQQLLEHQNYRLRNRLYFAMGIGVILLLIVLIFYRRRQLKKLKVDNQKLTVVNKDVAKVLEDLAELSYYETLDSLPLGIPLKVNELCHRLTSSSQRLCHRGVTMVYQTDLPDDFYIKTNPDALQKLLSHLLNNSARFNHQGTITLSCIEEGENVRFSVSDTTPDPTNKYAVRYIGLFAQQGTKLQYLGMTFKISQSIVRQLKGRIWRDTEYTKGVRLSFELPKDPQ